MSPARLLKAALFRLALLYVAIFTLSAIVLMAVVYLASTRLVSQQLHAAVAVELQALQAEFDRQGLEGLEQAIATRRSGLAARQFTYLLQDRAGARLAGGLPPTDPVPGWRTMLLPADESAEDEGESDERALAKGVVLADGGFLMVAHDMEQLSELQELLLSSALITIAVAVPLALIGGIVMSTVSLRRIEAINRVSEEIRRGELARRIARTGADDELDRLAANINAMLDSIQQLTDGLRQVSSDIAHDLRTPLSRLRQDLEMARSSGAGPGELRGAIARAIEQTDAILETFGALLRIAQIEAGVRRSGFGPVDLSELLESLIEVYQPVAEDAEHRLEARIEQGIAIEGDRELLTQMLANLIENALQHTPAGTRIEATLERAGGEVLTTFADDGPGIPEAARDKVFRRFFRLEASRTTPGSGLGLSLVAAIAALHAIRIELADNAPGLRITLRFPSSATT